MSLRLRATVLLGILLVGGAMVWRARRGDAPPVSPPGAPHVATVAKAPSPPARPASAPAPSEVAAAASNNEPANDAMNRIPTALREALAEADADERLHAIEAALRVWAAQDVEAAGAWAKAQGFIPRANAMAAVVNGVASADAERAVQYVTQLSKADAENAAEYGTFLIIGLSEAGEYARAVAWACGGDEPNIDWITSAYDRWALAKPETAMLHALALTDPVRRRAAADAAIDAWAKSDPHALAEAAVNFPAGQEKNLAIVTGLRAWAVNEPQRVSEWMLAHRDSIASVPNLATINED